MQDLWLLLRPSKAFDTRSRYEKCLADWSSMNEAQQRRVFRLLQAKKEQAELNPNPYYALNDAMQEDEQQARKAKPEFLRGDEPGPIVQVKYNGFFKLCRPETANLFHLTVTNEKWKT